MSGLHAEAPAADAAAPEAPSVGVLGWLGFVIINIAAWGIIGTASAISWGFGFGITLVYTAILIGMAACLRRYGPKYFAFENLLWVLACWFVFILGMFIVVNVIGPAYDEDRALAPENTDPWVAKPINNELQSLLPEGSSEALIAYAGSGMARVDTPTFAHFEGETFFSGQAEGSLDSILMRAGGSGTVEPTLADARSFVIHGGDVFFLARETEVAAGEAKVRRGMWSIRTAAHGVAEYVGGVQTLAVEVFAESALEAIDGELYFTADFQCPAGWARSIFHLDATGTVVDLLRDPTCPGVEPGDGGSATDPSRQKPTAQYWSAIFLACLPLIIMSALVLYFLRMPGAFTGLYAGPAFIIILVYLLAADHNTNHEPFYKWFLTIYASLGYMTFSAYSIYRGDDVPELLEQMKHWIVVVVGLLFFVMIHVDTEVPDTDAAGAWVVYALMIPVQMFFSFAMRHVVPLIFAAVFMFVCAWKIAREITRAIYGDNLGEEETIVLLAILALQGIGIIVAAIFYASNRSRIDALARSALSRCTKGSKEGRSAEITV
mmetsp:Transcript_59179/g.171577  ORF Transcript_59179/g.171577 Transcript_59179/m.171577 type:complete len:549 (-) Transcript_59179:7-1653(-)